MPVIRDFRGIEERRDGGESGIRTHVRVSLKHAFQACAFSHSAISPDTGWEALCSTPRKSLGKMGRPANVSFDSIGREHWPQPRGRAVWPDFVGHLATSL